jgi:hypothetical protein
MNNEQRGEVTFDVAGVPYMLRRSWNSICELEGLTGRGFYAMMAELQTWGPPLDKNGKPKIETAEQSAQRAAKISVSTLRAVFCAMLRDHKPELSLRQAGDLMDAIGIEKTIEHVMTAFARGTTPETKGENPPPLPAKHQNGASEAIAST